MFAIQYSPAVIKDIHRLPQPWRRKILNAIEGLKSNPFAGKKLHGKLASCHSLRVWPYRIIYTIQKHRLVIIIVAIGHRQGVYKT